MDDLLCVVCGDKVKHRSLVASCCDACRQFFLQKGHLASYECCYRAGQCFKFQPVKEEKRQCTHCRLERAHRAGVRRRELIGRQLQTNNDWMWRMVDNLIALDIIREDQFNTKMSWANPNVADVVNGDYRWVRRSVPFSIPDWCFVQALSTLEFLKKTPLMISYQHSDKVILLKKSYFMAAFMFWGFQTVQERIGSLQTPLVGGVREEIFPDFLQIHLQLRTEGVMKLRQIPVAIFQRARMTRKEMVVLLMIFCSYPVEKLSVKGRNRATNHENVYTSILREYCKEKYGIEPGAHRFTYLLSLKPQFKNYVDMVKALIVSIMSEPTNPRVKLLVCNQDEHINFV